MPAIESLMAMEILDSRGRPTVLARCRLRGGAMRERIGAVRRVDGVGRGA